MTTAHIRIQEIFNELYTLSISNKTLFLEHLLFYFTITSRAIWSDDKPTDGEKVEALKWLNELMHSVWNIRFELQRNEDNNSITRLYEHMKFYGEQSDLLRMHIVPTTFGAF